MIAWPVDFVIERTKGDMQRPLVMLGVTNSKAWDAIQEDESIGTFSLRKRKQRLTIALKSRDYCEGHPIRLSSTSTWANIHKYHNKTPDYTKEDYAGEGVNPVISEDNLANLGKELAGAVLDDLLKLSPRYYLKSA